MVEERRENMKRIDALKKIIEGNDELFFVSINGASIPGADLIRIYDILDEDITIGMTMDDIAIPRSKMPDMMPMIEKTSADVTEKKKVTRNRNVDKGKIKALFNAGWDMDKIADECKCSRQTVYKTVKYGG